ncbi:outer membrane lipid asymmetry maintenance protein MlaD [Pseudodesulfovibrio sp. F-1]|uniref:Outer membrane lipid asymmetry maintenance protein MlaD n=1 Tax=Pseudodesulfovibrio alkaliphilus TaxID=2661613 RepID=A0A7K1KP70_9BACT|nr:outer membrane lipid asymmetry maintenance protein MlaD [Pseudodesulfovibrio alkaliphilus]MUM77692.1 outer membrane lipid asymmetry maintenance protein MlaD [Pseudodesulfovibrio alkaliphilus]
MFKLNKETAVGLFVLVGLISIAYMSIKLGNVQLFTDRYYTVHADFSDVSGLKVNAPVQMFGVDIGFVKGIVLDQDKGMARVTMMIDRKVQLTDDAIVGVKTSGLIGDKFLKIAPGGLGDPIGDGDALFDTNPAIDLEDLISKFAFGKV